MATAMNGLKTVTNNPVADDIYEKITAISKNSNTGMILDFYSKSDRKQKELLLPKQSSAGKERCRVAEGCDNGSCVCRVPQDQ